MHDHGPASDPGGAGQTGVGFGGGHTEPQPGAFLVGRRGEVFRTALDEHEADSALTVAAAGGGPAPALTLGGGEHGLSLRDEQERIYRQDLNRMGHAAFSC